MEAVFEVKQNKIQGNYGEFIITPLQKGFGITLGVALRRVLLGALPGTAITTVQIKGVKHAFSTVKGMKEDVLDFLLNLKKVRIINPSGKKLNLSLSVDKQGEVKAADIKISGDAQIANPDLVLANLSKGGSLEAEMTAESGIGYTIADSNEEKTSIGVLELDANFSPVVRVNYKVEDTRVGRITNYDKLTLEVWTDGSIDPEAALKEASTILISYFSQIKTPREFKAPEVVKQNDSSGNAGKLSVEEIGLPTRVANALIKAGYDTVDNLVEAKKEDLVKVRNLGEKSLKIITAALADKGVRWEIK